MNRKSINVINETSETKKKTLLLQSSDRDHDKQEVVVVKYSAGSGRIDQ